MTDDTLSQAKTTATPEAPAIVTGGGHVYPPTWQGLASYRGHMATAQSQKRRDFQAFQEGGRPGGREGVCIQKNTIWALSDITIHWSIPRTEWTPSSVATSAEEGSGSTQGIAMRCSWDGSVKHPELVDALV